MVEKVTLGDIHLNALEYCAKGEMVETNMLTTDITEQGKQMIRVAASRPGLHQTCIHFSLSGTALDNEKLTTQDYQLMMREHLEKGQGIDLSRHQYSMFIHKEGSGRAHIHAVVNRISLDGADHNLWNYKNKGKNSCRNLEQKYNLEQVANDRKPDRVKLTSGEIRQKERTGEPVAKEIIAEAVERRIPEAASLEELKTTLRKDDVGMEILYNENGPYGLRFTARDPATGQRITMAGGQIASNCQCRAVISRIERAQQQTQPQGKTLTPWNKLQAIVKTAIPGCRTLDEFREKLETQGITLTINNDTASYTIDGKKYRGRLPRNATLEAVQERIGSTDTWQTIRDGVKTSIRGCADLDEFREKLQEAGIATALDPATGELSYTVNGRTIQGKQIPRNASLEAIRERIDRDQLWKTVNDTVALGIREGLDLDEIIDKLSEAGVTTHQRWTEDGKLEITGYSDGEITLDEKSMPKHCTAEAIRERIDNNTLWTGISEAVTEAIRDDADLDGVIAKIHESGIEVRRDENGGIAEYSMMLFLDKNDSDALDLPETRTISMSGDRVPAAFTLAGIQARIDRNALWKKLNETISTAIRDGADLDGIRDALKLAGIETTTGHGIGQITGYSDGKANMEGDRIPASATTAGLQERIKNHKAFRAQQLRARLAGAAAAFVAGSSGKEEDEYNRRNRPGM